MDTLIRVKNYLLEHLCACCISKEKDIEEYKENSEMSRQDADVLFTKEVGIIPMLPIDPMQLKLNHVDRQEEKIVRPLTPKRERTCFSSITIGKRNAESKPKPEVIIPPSPRRQETGYIKKALEPKIVSMKEEDSEEELEKEISEFGDGQDDWGEW